MVITREAVQLHAAYSFSSLSCSPPPQSRPPHREHGPRQPTAPSLFVMRAARFHFGYRLTLCY
jgi:hypothetical protein